jgi:hypothetical protein
LYGIESALSLIQQQKSSFQQSLSRKDNELHQCKASYEKEITSIKQSLNSEALLSIKIHNSENENRYLQLKLDYERKLQDQASLMEKNTESLKYQLQEKSEKYQKLLFIIFTIVAQYKKIENSYHSLLTAYNINNKLSRGYNILCNDIKTLSRLSDSFKERSEEDEENEEDHLDFEDTLVSSVTTKKTKTNQHLPVSVSSAKKKKKNVTHNTRSISLDDSLEHEISELESMIEKKRVTTSHKNRIHLRIIAILILASNRFKNVVKEGKKSMIMSASTSEEEVKIPEESSIENYHINWILTHFSDILTSAQQKKRRNKNKSSSSVLPGIFLHLLTHPPSVLASSAASSSSISDSSTVLSLDSLYYQENTKKRGKNSDSNDLIDVITYQPNRLEDLNYKFPTQQTRKELFAQKELNSLHANLLDLITERSFLVKRNQKLKVCAFFFFLFLSFFLSCLLACFLSFISLFRILSVHLKRN